MKSELRSEALRKRWEMIPAEKRSLMASRAAKARWLNATVEQKLAQSVLMNNKKYESKTNN